MGVYDPLWDGETNMKDDLSIQKGAYSSDRFAAHLGAYHMIGKDDWEPQRNNNFEMHIFGLDNLYNVVNGEKINEGVAHDTLTLSTVSVTGLNVNMSPIMIPYMNTKVKYAGLPTINDATITFNDFIGKDTEKILTAWFGLVFNQRTEAIGRASVYKKPAVLVETAPDGTHARGWQLDGTWISQLQLGNYDYSQGNVRQVTATFTYDRLIPIDEGELADNLGLRAYISHYTTK